MLYIHNRPSGGAGESLYQLVYDNQLWNSKGAIFLNPGFLKQKFDRLEPGFSSYYLKGSSWLGAIKNQAWLYWPTQAYYFLKSENFIRQIDQIIKQQNIDILHTNTINIIEGGIIGKRRNIPHFVQVRELLDLDYYQYPVSKKWIVTKLLRYADMLIANSIRTKEGLLKLGAEASKIKVIYNAVSPTSDKKDIRAFLRIPEDTKVVALVGWITPNKMVEDFLSIAGAFQNRTNTKFVIIGGYGFNDRYNQLIKSQMQLLPNVVHTGIIPNATEYFASFDLLICTCYTESYGRSVAEALIEGTPAIGVKSCAVAELIQHNKSGFVIEKSDINSLVHYTEQLLDNPTLNREMGHCGMKDAEKRFGIKTIRQEYLNLYEEYLG